MAQAESVERRARLAVAYEAVRERTEVLAAPLSPEDQTVQSMPDVSPTKWHRGHTSWFFETFLLEPGLTGYRVHHPAYSYIFNSYYEAAGPRHPRDGRGLISRPGVDDVTAYRRHVDAGMAKLMGASQPRKVLDLAELGLHHEQQHQELLLMDIKHVLWSNPLLPAYADWGPRRTRRPATPGRRAAGGRPAEPGWTEHRGGAAEIGHAGSTFAFDNESPRHAVQLVPFALADRAVTCGEWLAFIDDDGYRRPDLWLSDGWAAVQQHRWAAPLYWLAPGEQGAGEAGVPADGRRPDGAGDNGWRVFSLAGVRPLDPVEPVCHISYYEADAFARWRGARLPTEAEWEVAVTGMVKDRGVAAAVGDDGGPAPGAGPVPGRGALQPAAAEPPQCGQVWEWTASAYSPYPGFRAAPGAVGEYNGKFMVSQQVLRGGACVTPPGHARATYRNFFPPAARWAFSGLRLAKDL